MGAAPQRDALGFVDAVQIAAGAPKHMHAGPNHRHAATFADAFASAAASC